MSTTDHYGNSTTVRLPARVRALRYGKGPIGALPFTVVLWHPLANHNGKKENLTVVLL